MENVIILEMTQNDINAVQGLIEQLNGLFQTKHDISINAINNTFNEMKLFNNMYKNYVAVVDNKIVGFISGVIYKSFFHNKGTLLINELIVDKDYRGNKIGDKLINHVIKAANDLGLNEVEVSTTFENDKAVDFYKKQGLTDVSLLLGIEINI